MGNKQGKTRRSTNTAPTARARGADSQRPAPSSMPPPPAPSAPASSSSTGSSASAPAAPHSASEPPPPAMSRIHPLLASKLSLLDVSTIFSPHEVLVIRKHVAALLGQHEDEPIVIDQEEFYRVLGASTSSLYVTRLYAIFDMTGKGTVDFEDLMRGLSVLSQKASREQKLLLSFHLLDPEGKGYVTKQTTTELLKSCLAECTELNICLSDAEIASIVDNTFDEADLDKNELVDLNEYQALDVSHPGLFDFLTVDAIGVLSHLEKVRSTASGLEGEVAA